MTTCWNVWRRSARTTGTTGQARNQVGCKAKDDHPGAKEQETGREHGLVPVTVVKRAGRGPGQDKRNGVSAEKHAGVGNSFLGGIKGDDCHTT
ncbi:MAG: hypothetical protein AB1426_11320 [Bacillota bacterium]